MCGKWTCAARLRSGLLCGFSHLWVCFPARVLSMPHAAQPAQQRCKTDPRNVHSAQPEDGKFKSVYEKGRNSMQLSWILFSMKIGLRLSCLKLSLSCLLPLPLFCLLQTFMQQMKQSSCIQLLDSPDSLEVQVLGQSSISSQN